MKIFLKILWRNAKVSYKELRSYEKKFAKVVYDRLIVRDKRSRPENAEEGDSCLRYLTLTK